MPLSSPANKCLKSVLWMVIAGALIAGWSVASGQWGMHLLIWVAAAVFLYHCTVGVLGKKTAGLLVAAGAYYASWLYYFPNSAYTNDIEGHIRYIRHLRQDIWDAYNYYHTEFWHPPTYYALAALWLDVTKGVFGWETFTTLRIFSLCLYLVFCVFSIKTLRLYNPAPDRVYYLGCLLILFWPAAILMATRITNDILVYTVWSIFFYYFARWLHNNRPIDLAVAIMLAGLCIMVKMPGAALLAIVGLTMLLRLFTGQMRFVALFKPWMLASYLVVLAGGFVNQARSIYPYLKTGDWPVFLGSGKSIQIPLSRLWNFDVGSYITRPYIGYYDIDTQPDNFTYFAKSALFGEFTWNNIPIASMMNMLFILLLLLTIIGLIVGIVSKKLHLRDVAPLLISILVPYAMLIVFYNLRRVNQCMDARFVYPMLMTLVVLFTMATRSLHNRAQNALYLLALCVGFGLAELSVIHYLSYMMVTP